MKNFKLSQKEYNNLLPVIPLNVCCNRSKDKDSYYFFGTYEDYKDAMRRCLYLTP
jgi:hypothetical protein